MICAQGTLPRLGNYTPVCLVHSSHSKRICNRTGPSGACPSSPKGNITCGSSATNRPQQKSSGNYNKRPILLTNDDPLALAFLGDAIWSLCVRNHFLNPPKHFRLYQSAVKPFITAEGQAAAYDNLLSQQLLTQQEVEFLQYVYSYGMKFRKRFATKAAEDAYRKATALEALVGYLHLHEPQRLQVIVNAVLPYAGNQGLTSAQSLNEGDV